ncbi:MAG TPA: hydroxymethylglutaryl-CoA lyase [Thermoanaerobaculia bacterium]|nr:hydroxymethylglutaryl-CoA lyase [Thermoanaerobaculia bacterium]
MNVAIHEVGPRDGLQIEKKIIPTAAKIAWIEELIESGVDAVQLGSFVNPERVPQMADTERLFEYFIAPERKPKRTALTALVLNEKGLDRGFACGVTDFCMGASASDTHSRKNTGMSTEEAATRIVAMARRALQSGMRVQVSVQSAFGCGYEGVVPKEHVLNIVSRYLDAGLTTISLADTAGQATPLQVEDLFGAIRDFAPRAVLACHFHDTYGMALANCYAALRAGVQSFESAVAGLGGCPFTAITGGNVATEDLVYMLQGMGMRDDIALEPLVDAATMMERLLERTLPGVVHRVPKPESRIPTPV